MTRVEQVRGGRKREEGKREGGRGREGRCTSLWLLQVWEG
jgi:hypothetical protein